MISPSFILADDFNGWGKLIGGVIVVIFWGLRALLGGEEGKRAGET